MLTEEENALVAEQMGDGWTVAREAGGAIAFAKMREPKTHMGGWCLDIQTRHDILTIVFEREQIKLLAMQILDTL